MSFFRLQRCDSKGVSFRTHLEAAARMLGYDPPELQAAEIPLGLVHLFELFADLTTARTRVEPFTWTELGAWLGLRRLVLSGYQLNVLRAIDRAYLRAFGGVR